MEEAELQATVKTVGVAQSTAELNKFADAAADADRTTAQLGRTAQTTGGAYVHHIGSSVRRTQVAVQQLTGAFTKNEFQMRSLVWQLNQVTQTGMVTGQWMQAMAIQLPDILAAFGLWGIAAGALVGGLWPLAKGLAQTTDESEKLEEVMNNLTSAVGSYEKAVATATRNTAELREEYGRFFAEVVPLLSKQAESQMTSTMETIAGAVREGFDLSLERIKADSEKLRRSFEIPDAMALATPSRAANNAKEKELKLLQEQEALLNNIQALSIVSAPDDQVDLIRRIIEQTKELAGAIDGISEKEQGVIDILEEQLRLTMKTAAAYEEMNAAKAAPLPEKARLHEWAMIDEMQDLPFLEGSGKSAKYWENYAEGARRMSEAIRLGFIAERKEIEANERAMRQYQQTRMAGRWLDEREEGAAYLTKLQKVQDYWRQFYKEQEEAQQRRIAGERQYYNETRSLSNQAFADAQQLLQEIQQRVEMERLILQYGEDSVQVSRARADAEQAATRELIASADISDELKAELLAALSAEQRMAAINLATPIYAAADAASALTARMQSALSSFVAFREGLNAQIRESNLEAAALEKFAGNPIGLGGQRAVNTYKTTFDGLGVYEMESAAWKSAIGQQEQSIRQLGEATTEAQIRAENAAKAHNDLMFPKSSGGGGGGGGAKADLKEHNRLLREAEDILEETANAAELYAQQLALINQLATTVNPQTGNAYLSAEQYKQALRGLQDEYYGITEAAESMEQATTQMFTAIFSGAESAKDAVGELLREFGNMALNAAFGQLLEGAFSGIAPIFAIPAREKGGPVERGRAYLVGEKRPELFVPSSNGTILPSVPSGGTGSIHVSPIINVDARGADTATVARLDKTVAGMVASFKEQTLRAVREAQMEGKLY